MDRCVVAVLRPELPCAMSRIPRSKPSFFGCSRNFYFYFLMFENYSAFEVKHVSDLSALSKKLFFG